MSDSFGEAQLNESKRSPRFLVVAPPMSSLLPYSLDLLVPPQCRLPVRPRERRHHVGGVPHGEAGPGDILLISPRQVRVVAVLEAMTVKDYRRWPGERRGGGLMEKDIQESLLFRCE